MKWYLRLCKLAGDKVDGKNEEPCDNAVDELKAGVMYSCLRASMQLYQTLFNGRHQSYTEAEEQSEYDSGKRYVVATVVTVKSAVRHEMLNCLTVLCRL